MPKLKGYTDLENKLILEKCLVDLENKYISEHIQKQEARIRLLESKNKILSSRLIESQDTYQGQAIFLDALENLLEEHGFKVVSTNE